LQTISTATTTRSVSTKNDSVGVIIPDPGSGPFSDPGLPRVLQGIEEVLSENGIQMLLFVAHSNGRSSRLERYLAAGHVDAVIVLGLFEPAGFPATLESIGLPVVYGGRPRDARNTAFVHVDDHAAGRCATQHLIEQGRRRIAHLAGPLEAATTSERLQGFREAMWDAALRSDLVEHAGLDRDSGEMAMSRLLNRRDDIDAVFAASDAMAAGAMWATQILGRRVPDDVAIIGFDDSPLAMLTSPSLSSVRRPIEEMGREMARLVIEMSGTGTQGEPRQLILDPALAVRESTTVCRSTSV
jgi:DNA-binding LacI/PurR family transcriptional regulator